MSKLLTMTPEQFCDATDACSDNRQYALTQTTMADVWNNCPRADWLLFIVNRLDQNPDDRTLRLFAIWCARNTPLADGRKIGELLTYPRSLAAVEVAQRYADGKSSREELAAARAAAAAAARAADAASDAAWAAADVAADPAWFAARDAARDAAWAAAGAAAGAASKAAGAASRKAQADQLRTMMPNPFKEAKP